MDLRRGHIPAHPEGIQQMDTSTSAYIPSSSLKMAPVVSNEKTNTGTQTSPAWDELLSLCLQKQLAQKLEPHIGYANDKENACIHQHSLTLDKVLGFIKEHHKLLCVINKRNRTLPQRTLQDVYDCRVVVPALKINNAAASKTVGTMPKNIVRQNSQHNYEESGDDSDEETDSADEDEHEDNRWRTTCDYCGRYFTSYRSTYMHEQKVHGIEQIEILKKNIHKRALDMALEIVNSDMDAPGGNKRKKLSGKTYWENMKAWRNRRIMEAANKQIDPLRNSDTMNVKSTSKQEDMSPMRLDLGNGSPEKSDMLTCPVYSQSPEYTLEMIQTNSIAFAVAPSSKSSEIIGTHMCVVSSSTGSESTQMIVISTNMPNVVKAKLAKGELRMDVLPMSMKPPEDDQVWETHEASAETSVSSAPVSAGMLTQKTTQKISGGNMSETKKYISAGTSVSSASVSVATLTQKTTPKISGGLVSGTKKLSAKTSVSSSPASAGRLTQKTTPQKSAEKASDTKKLSSETSVLSAPVSVVGTLAQNNLPTNSAEKASETKEVSAETPTSSSSASAGRLTQKIMPQKPAQTASESKELSAETSVSSSPVSVGTLVQKNTPQKSEKVSETEEVSAEISVSSGPVSVGTLTQNISPTNSAEKALETKEVSAETPMLSSSASAGRLTQKNMTRKPAQKVSETKELSAETSVSSSPVSVKTLAQKNTPQKSAEKGSETKEVPAETSVSSAYVSAGTFTQKTTAQKSAQKGSETKELSAETIVSSTPVSVGTLAQKNTPQKSAEKGSETEEVSAETSVSSASVSAGTLTQKTTAQISAEKVSEGKPEKRLTGNVVDTQTKLSSASNKIEDRIWINQRGKRKLFKDSVTCNVYSQTPELAAQLIKKGDIKYVVAQSDTSVLKGVHMRTVPVGPDNKQCHSIVIYTNKPKEIQTKVDYGRLHMILQKPAVPPKP